MNFKKFISGVSALTIAASAFAGMAVTANAETDHFNKNGDEVTAGTKVIETTSTSYVDAGENANFQIKTNNAGIAARLLVLNGTTNNDGTNGKSKVPSLTHGDNNNFYVAAMNGARRQVTVTPKNSEAISQYGEIGVSFAAPNYSDKGGGSTYSNRAATNQAYVNLGDIAKVALTNPTGTTGDMTYSLAVSALSNGGTITTSAPATITVNIDSWVDAKLYFNLEDSGTKANTAKLILTYNNTEYEYYFTNVTSSSITTMEIAGVGSGGGGSAERWGAVAFDDVLIKELSEAPDTVTDNGATLTVNCVETAGGEPIATYDIACMKNDTVDITADPQYKSFYDIGDSRYTYSSGDTAPTITSTTQTVELIYTSALIVYYTYTLNATGDYTGEIASGSVASMYYPITVYYPRYVYDSSTGTVYEGDKQSGTPNYGKYRSSLTDNVSDNVEFKKAYENVVYFEDFDDSTGNGVFQQNYASNGAVKNNAAWSTTLKKGNYHIYAYVCGRGRGSNITVGDNSWPISSYASSNLYGLLSEDFTVNADDTTIQLTKGESAYDPIDTVIIVKTGEYTPAAPTAEFAPIDWEKIGESDYVVSGNAATKDGVTVYAYSADLAGDGTYTYNVKADLTPVTGTAKTDVSFGNLKGDAVLYIITNRELKSSSVYCD